MSRVFPVQMALNQDYLDRLDQMADEREGGNRSALIRFWIDREWATRCPICGSETRPDHARPGCRWCDACQEATIFEGEDHDRNN